MPLFPDEKTIARAVMGTRAKEWPATARYLEDKHGLPRIDTLMGGRFWPAVVEFFRLYYGMKPQEALDGEGAAVPSLETSPSVSPSIRVVPFKPDGKEDYSSFTSRPRGRR